MMMFSDTQQVYHWLFTVSRLIHASRTGNKTRAPHKAIIALQITLFADLCINLSEMCFGNPWWCTSVVPMKTGPLFTKKMPFNRYRSSHYKFRTCWWQAHVYNGNPNTNKTLSSKWIEVLDYSSVSESQGIEYNVRSVLLCCVLFLLYHNLLVHCGGVPFTMVLMGVKRSTTWILLSMDLYMYLTCRQVSNIRRTLVGNYIFDHSDVVGASPVGAAPTTSSFST